MDSSAITATQAIQAILAPAIMISSMGLFLLGLNARQASVFSRIRLLNQERRTIAREVNNGHSLAECDDIRCLSIDHQLTALLQRAWYIRSSIICHTSAVVFFVLTSFALGVKFVLSHYFPQGIALYLFLMGMFLVLAGVICIGIDEWIAYSVILIEAKRPD
ncbi:MAG: DUF2721 domain-containing protein [Actinomycetota bacterium]